MMLFGVEVLRIPFNSSEFWALPRAFFIAARIYHEDRIDAEQEAAERAKQRAKR